MTPEAGTAPDPVADFFAAADSREAARKDKAPAKKKKAETAESAEQTETAEPDRDTASAKEASSPETAAPAAPEQEESADLSFMPEELRSKVPTLSKELKAWMKEQAEAASFKKRYEDLNPEFTRKSQALAEAEKEAALWRQIKANPKAAKAAMEALEDKEPAADADDDWDFTEHTSKENKAYIRKMIAKESAGVAEEKAKAVLTREIIEPQRRTSAIGDAIAKFASEENIPEATVVEAIKVAKVEAENLGIAWSPENAARLVKLGISLMPARTTTPAAKNDGPGLSRVASPQTRGVGTTAAKIPAWKAKGKTWPTNNDERAEFFDSLDIGDAHASE